MASVTSPTKTPTYSRPQSPPPASPLTAVREFSVNDQHFHPFLTDTKYQYLPTTAPRTHHLSPSHLYKINMLNYKTHKNLSILSTLNTLNTLNFSRMFNNPHMGFHTRSLRTFVFSHSHSLTPPQSKKTKVWPIAARPFRRRLSNTDNEHHPTFNRIPGLAHGKRKLELDYDHLRYRRC